MQQFIVQPFSGKGGRLKPGKPIAARSERAACDEARRYAEEGTGGAAAIRIDIDDDTGDTVSVKVLEKVGALPENFDETVGA